MESTGRFAELGQRVVSALVLLPPVLAAVWFGGVWFLLLVAAAAALAGWELGGLLRLAPASRVVMAAFYGLMAPVIWHLGVLRDWQALVLLAAAPALVVGMAARLLGALRLAWGAAGFAWIWLGLASALWLRAQEEGLQLILWLLATVWVTDIAGYFVGRLVGGPKLAPRISPGKTWSGLIGAVLLAALAGWLAAAALFEAAGPRHAVAAAVLAVVAQAGDLLESAIKRHFAVKDAGRLIPGHGGLLDRIDGLLLAAPALALGLTFVA